jgi:hypothetical protein
VVPLNDNVYMCHRLSTCAQPLKTCAYQLAVPVWIQGPAPTVGWTAAPMQQAQRPLACMHSCAAAAVVHESLQPQGSAWHIPNTQSHILVVAWQLPAGTVCTELMH